MNALHNLINDSRTTQINVYAFKLDQFNVDCKNKLDCFTNKNHIFCLGEAIYVKCMTKTPGMSFNMEETELDLSYNTR